MTVTSSIGTYVTIERDNSYSSTVVDDFVLIILIAHRIHRADVLLRVVFVWVIIIHLDGINSWAMKGFASTYMSTSVTTYTD